MDYWFYGEKIYFTELVCGLLHFSSRYANIYSFYRDFQYSVVAYWTKYPLKNWSPIKRRKKIKRFTETMPFSINPPALSTTKQKKQFCFSILNFAES